MGCFPCLKWKRRGRDVREKGAVPAYTNSQDLNEPQHNPIRVHPSPVADPKTLKRATSSAKELDAHEYCSASHREKAEGRAASPAKELHSKPIAPGESLPSTPHKKSVSPDPETPQSPPFVDSGIGTPVSKGSTPVASRSTSSQFIISTVYDFPPTPTPSRSYVSTGSSPLASPIVPSLPKVSLTHTRPEEFPAGPSVPNVPQTRSVEEEYPTSLSTKVNLKPEPKVRNPLNFGNPAPEPVTPHIPPIAPEPESASEPQLAPEPQSAHEPEPTPGPHSAPELPNTQTHSRHSSPSNSPPFYTAAQTPQPQVYTFGSETAHQFTHQAPTSHRFTAWVPSPQGTQVSQPFIPTAQSTQGARPTQLFNSHFQSSQSSTSTTQSPQSTQSSQAFSPSTQSSQSTQFSQPSYFNSPPPQRAQAPQSTWQSQSAWQPQPFASATQQAPQPFATNTVIPPHPTGQARGTFCRCGARNNVYTTRSDENYNRGRKFRKCPRCPKWDAFNGFTDQRGLSGTGNPNCECFPPEPMRLALNRKEDSCGRKTAFYSCQYNLCGVENRTYEIEKGVNKLFERSEILQWVARDWL